MSAMPMPTKFRSAEMSPVETLIFIAPVAIAVAVMLWA